MVIQSERIQNLNEGDTRRGRYVLYWMQQSQRARCNHALEYAIRRANGLKLPLVVLFAITQRFPEANARHYAFMLEGLAETEAALRRRGIRLVIRVESPVTAATKLSKQAALLVTDRGYLRVQKRWRRRVAESVPCRMEQVEADVVVPVEVASGKEEYAARTIRPKIHRHLPRFLKGLEETKVERGSLRLPVEGEMGRGTPPSLEKLRVGRGVGPVSALKGGASEAERLLGKFVSDKLGEFSQRRNDPSGDFVSHMSPYLHFGQISPLWIALNVIGWRGVRDAEKEAYLEELIVRRELSMNFCEYNPKYDSFEAVPEWARKTLRKHEKDGREYSYGVGELEGGKTHDPYWNAAQKEMVLTGKMQGYMRMYWGKKILEWLAEPGEAFGIALHLNNKYELDGRDPNSFAGVAWCFGKHDRPWADRRVFGTVRYMSASGLERKFDIGAYVRKAESLG